MLKDRVTVQFAYLSLGCDISDSDEQIKNNYEALIEKESNSNKRNLFKSCYDFIMKLRQNEKETPSINDKETPSINDKEDVEIEKQEEPVKHEFQHSELALQKAYTLLGAFPNESIEVLKERYKEKLSENPLLERILSDSLRVLIDNILSNENPSHDHFIMNKETYDLIKIVNRHHEEVKLKEQEKTKKKLKSNKNSIIYKFIDDSAKPDKLK